jgi:hypothetical protein
VSKSYRHPCGCRSTDSAWVELCVACKAEHDERHIRAAADKNAREQQKAQQVAA